MPILIQNADMPLPGLIGNQGFWEHIKKPLFDMLSKRGFFKVIFLCPLC